MEKHPNPAVQDCIDYVRRYMEAKDPKPELTVDNYFKFHPEQKPTNGRI